MPILATLPLLLAGTHLPASQNAPPANDQPLLTLPKVEVDQRIEPFWKPKLQYLMPEVDGALITATTKATVTHMDQIPTVAQDNLTQLFVRT
ncbi:MAG TPA: hypothetical protein VFN42_09265, partial [Acetobacteraceae bacterium]|nr:hypothetical protein [Acetobacteraceae bacterium]